MNRHLSLVQERKLGSIIAKNLRNPVHVLYGMTKRYGPAIAIFDGTAYIIIDKNGKDGLLSYEEGEKLWVNLSSTVAPTNR